eukprot:909464-Amphidinium_carterae.1
MMQFASDVNDLHLLLGRESNDACKKLREEADYISKVECATIMTTATTTMMTTMMITLLSLRIRCFILYVVSKPSLPARDPSMQGATLPVHVPLNCQAKVSQAKC